MSDTSKEQALLTFLWDPSWMPSLDTPPVYRANPRKWNGVEVVSGFDKADHEMTAAELLRLYQAGEMHLISLQDPTISVFTPDPEKTGSSPLGIYGNDIDYHILSGVVNVLCYCDLEVDSGGEKTPKKIRKVTLLGSLTVPWGTRDDGTISAIHERHPDEPGLENEAAPLDAYSFKRKYKLTSATQFEWMGRPVQTVPIFGTTFATIEQE